MLFHSYNNSTPICLFAILVFIGIGNLACTKNEVGNEQATDTITVSDFQGKKVELPANITRVVSLAPNLTEIAFAVGGGDKIVGDTSYCNYPEGAKEVAKVGDTIKPNIEAIVALKPQVVLVSTASQLESFTNALTAQGIKVYVSDPNSIEEIYKSILNIGTILGEKEEAQELIKTMKVRISEVAKRVKDEPLVSTFVQIDRSLYTVGGGSFISDIVKDAGGKLSTEDETDAYFKISKERATSLNPDAIIITDSPDNDSPSDVFDDSNAVKTKTILKMNPDILSRPGPRSVDAIEVIADFLHPRESN